MDAEQLAESRRQEKAAMTRFVAVFNTLTLILLVVAVLTALDIIEWPMPRIECVGPWNGPSVCKEVW
jgi:hypothetical protein